MALNTNEQKRLVRLDQVLTGQKSGAPQEGAAAIAPVQFIEALFHRVLKGEANFDGDLILDAAITRDPAPLLLHLKPAYVA